MKALVIATNRLKGFLEWKDKWDVRIAAEDVRLYVMVDTDDRAFADKVKIHANGASVFSHADVSQSLKGKAWIIPNGSSACKSWAIYRAWKDGADTIYCLDDDCYPDDLQWFQSHARELRKAVNNTLSSTALGIRPRGIPYVEPAPVMLSHGGWIGIPDIDAITQLYGGLGSHTMIDRVVTRGALFPFCGMNWACRRPAAPLMYFGLQGKMWPVDRFDDIWCGFIAKKIMDHLGWAVHTGEPCIEHMRASDPFVNIEKEAHGYGMNVEFYRFIAGYIPDGETALDCLRHAGKAIQAWGGKQKKDSGYWKKYGEAIQEWTLLFKED